MAEPELEELGSELTLYAARLIRWLRKERVQPVGMRVLSILDELGPTGVTALAAVDQCSQPTMSGTVTGLVDRGWVTKEPEPADARATVVSLTAEGVAVLRAARRSNGSLVAEQLRLTDLTPTDVADAVAVLRSLLDPPKGSS
jgi:DNA-binding MarR family transcriptional regulator